MEKYRTCETIFSNLCTTLELFHELLCDTAGRTQTNSVIHPRIERRMSSQVS